MKRTGKMEKITNPFKLVEEFHNVFAPAKSNTPTPFSPQEAINRAEFKAEELVEFLYGAANNDQQVFHQLVETFKVAIDQAEEKIINKQMPVTDPLVDEVDALTDLLYFTYGSFLMMGVDPTEIFSIVHQANMGKLFPDGKPHYHPITHKVLKPGDWEEKYAPEAKIKKELEKQKKNSLMPEEAY